MKHLELSLATLTLAALAGCASNPHADIRAHSAPDAEFSRYSTFGFPEQTGAWPLYDNDVRTVTYPVGTANIDIVDARKKQMIWEGVAQGRVRDAEMDNPREAISSVVTQLFARFPGRAGIVENSRQTSASGQ